MTNTMTASATAPDTGTAILDDPWATTLDDDPWPRCQARWVCPNGCTDQRCDRRAVWCHYRRCTRCSRPATVTFYCDQCADALIAQGDITCSELELL